MGCGMLFAMRVMGKLPEEISFEFNLKSKADTVRLAQAFAKVVSPEAGLQSEFTIGLSGESGIGKTTFSRALFGALGVDLSMEELNADVVRKSSANGEVFFEHADLKDTSDFSPHGNAEAEVNIFVIEHYEHDYTPEIEFEFEATGDNSRAVTLSCYEDLADQDEFHQFLEDVSDLRM